MTTIETIEEVVCKVRGIDPEDLHRRTRRREICETRQIVMYFAVLDKHTQAFTSRYFGLEHCSAIHARKNVERLVSVDKAIRLDVAIIRKRLSEDENEQLAYLSSIEKIAV